MKVKEAKGHDKFTHYIKRETFFSFLPGILQVFSQNNSYGLMYFCVDKYNEIPRGKKVTPNYWRSI